MPTWANHFRIADKLLPHLKTLNMEYFIIGNIAPDCGIPDKEHGVYRPPTGATHFTKDYEYSKKTDCDYEYIYRQFVQGERNHKKQSFFIGYYTHLFADCYYANQLFVPIEAKYGDFRQNEALRRQVAAERNNIDFLYFAQNVSPSFERFKTYQGFCEPYPEWYQNHEIARQMQNIVRHYTVNQPKEMAYRYLTPQIMSNFVDEVCQALLEDLTDKGLMTVCY